MAGASDAVMPCLVFLWFFFLGSQLADQYGLLSRAVFRSISTADEVEAGYRGAYYDA